MNKQLAKKEEKIKSQKEEVDLLKGSLSTSHSKISKLNKDIDKIEEQLAMKNGSNPEDYSAFKVRELFLNLFFRISYTWDDSTFDDSKVSKFLVSVILPTISEVPGVSSTSY